MSTEDRQAAIEHFMQLAAGKIFTERDNGGYINERVHNLYVSKCYACHQYTVWVHDTPLHPTPASGPEPHPDLPEDVRIDYEEARRVLPVSPRGSAALLRLAIQKLCVHLGGTGKDLNADIGMLVTKGLSPIVQQSLDIVRVVGNEAVHPGTMDLKDDRDTAMQLFRLVNLITDQMIAHPKQVDDLYHRLPEAKRKAIEARDAKKK